MAFGDVVHQYGSLHKRIIAKRQGREPINSLPGGGAGTDDEGESSTSLSLGRPSASADTGDDDDDDDTTTPTSQRESTASSVFYSSICPSRC